MTYEQMLKCADYGDTLDRLADALEAVEKIDKIILPIPTPWYLRPLFLVRVILMKISKAKLKEVEEFEKEIGLH